MDINLSIEKVYTSHGYQYNIVDGFGMILAIVYDEQHAKVVCEALQTLAKNN